MDSNDSGWLEDYAKVYSQPSGTPNFDYIRPRRREFLADLEREIIRLQSLISALTRLASALPQKLEAVSTPRSGLVGFIFGPKIVLQRKYQHVTDHLGQARQALIHVTHAREHFIRLEDGSHQFTTLSPGYAPDRLSLEAESVFLETRINESYLRINESYLFRIEDGRNLVCKRCSQSLLCDVGIKVYEHIYCYTCAKDLFRVGGLTKRNFRKSALYNPDPIWLVIREDDTSIVKRPDVLKRDHFACRDCGKQRSNHQLEAHHVLPRKHGGEDRITNLVTLCTYCHDRETWFRHFRKDPSTLGEGIKNYNRKTSKPDSEQTAFYL